jgi:PAS domain S-box-containing protein
LPNTLFPHADPQTKLRLDADPMMHLVNTFDWSATELGAICDWPEALRSATRFVLTSDTPMVLLAGRRDGVLIYNKGYAQFAGARHPEIFGMPALEAWPEIADFNAGNMRRGFAGESWELTNQEMSLNRRGTLEPAWLNLSYSPVLADNGEAVALAVIVHEVTGQVQSERARKDSEVRFLTLADTMPQMVWSTLPDGYHDYYNARWYEFTGVPAGSTDGDGWSGMFHPDDQERAWELWRHSLETGEPYKIEYRLRHHTGEYRWVLGRALPIRNAAGEITRWFGTCTDIHETRMMAEEREVIAQELSHRIKNIFSVITGIVALSARANPEYRGYSDQLRDRIMALGRAHDFVRPHSRASQRDANPHSFAALFNELMLPYRSAERDAVRFVGDDTAIDDRTATPLALIFHELATNSAKYGALSGPNGFVELRGKVDGPTYRLTWKEQGGPATRDPQGHEGFGSRLLKLSAESQLRGTLVRHWDDDGLRVEIELPLESLAAPRS